MTTVYIVTTGSYSDYRINAVFSTPELAQTYIDRCQFDQYAEPGIEEYEVDDVDMEWLNSKLSSYIVYIWKNSPDVAHARVLTGLQAEFESEEEKFYCFMVFAESKEHAAKIAMERRSIQIIKDELLKAQSTDELQQL